MRTADFYSVNEEKKPLFDRVYHNNTSCGPGKEIPLADRRPGTNNYRLCKDCQKL
jgi:hypothetical protein